MPSWSNEPARYHSRRPPSRRWCAEAAGHLQVELQERPPLVPQAGRQAEEGQGQGAGVLVAVDGIAAVVPRLERPDLRAAALLHEAEDDVPGAALVDVVGEAAQVLE